MKLKDVFSYMLAAASSAALSFQKMYENIQTCIRDADRIGIYRIKVIIF